MKFGRVVTIAAAALLAGCATGHFADPKPGQYADYRAFAYAHYNWTLQGVDPSLMQDVRYCAVDVEIDHMTPTELEHWNAYARGEVQESQSAWLDFDRALQKRVGDAIPVMQKKCPDTMAELAKYKV